MILLQKLYHIIFLFLCISHIELTATQKKSQPSMEEVFKRSREYYQAHPDKRRIDEEPSHWGQELMLEQRLQLQERPFNIQAAVNDAHRNIKNRTGWPFNGIGFYGLMHSDERTLLKKLASEDNPNNVVCILDIGCASGGWGNEAIAFLQKECSESKKRFHIFSITGGVEQENELSTFGNITHYRFNQFKIENLKEEFLARDFNLEDIENRFDLIVSNLLLLHLVDPIGTINQLYSLLKPGSGMLMTSGFGFYFNNSKQLEYMEQLAPVFKNSSGVALYCLRDFGFDHHQTGNHLLLFRPDDKPLNLPLAYDYSKQAIYHNQLVSESKMATTFVKSPDVENVSLNYYTIRRKQKNDSINVHLDSNFTIYHQKGDDRAENLLNRLIQNGFFNENFFGNNQSFTIIGRSTSKLDASSAELHLGKMEDLYLQGIYDYPQTKEEKEEDLK